MSQPISIPILNYRPAQFKPRKNARDPLTRWQPTKWKPEYETVVSLHARGKTNLEIAELTGYHPVQISNILNCDEGKAVARDYSNAIRGQTSDRLERIGDLAFHVIEEVLGDKELLENSPLALIDRSMNVLKGLGKLVPSDIGTGNTVNINTQNNAILGNDALDTIINGLKKSEQARVLNLNEVGASRV